MVKLSEAEQRNTAWLDSMVGDLMGVQVPPQRVVDRIEPRARTREMKVLCLGMSRTGTFSMHAALEQLGYRPYHMAEVMRDAPTSFPAWMEALSWKFDGVGKPWGRAEFDKLTADYDCIEDVPCICFAEEFIKAYPDAKVVLTHRPVNDWVRSFRRAVLPVLHWRGWPLVAWADPDLVAPWHAFAVSGWFVRIFGELAPGAAGEDSADPRRTHPRGAAARYADHYAAVRAACPPERLLEFELGDGWDKLCPFLGVEAPDGPYPHVNDSAFFTAIHAAMWRRAAGMAVGKVVGGLAAVAAAVGAAAVVTGRVRLRA